MAHPFLIERNSERAKHYFFVKAESFDPDGNPDPERELGPGLHQLSVAYHYGDATRRVELPSLNLTMESLVSLRSGGGSVIYEPTKAFRELVSGLSGG